MASVFISHSARDNVQAERIRQSLKAAGFATVYLDFDPTPSCGRPTSSSSSRRPQASARSGATPNSRSRGRSGGRSCRCCSSPAGRDRICAPHASPGSTLSHCVSSRSGCAENRAFRRVGPSLRTPRVRAVTCSRLWGAKTRFRPQMRSFARADRSLGTSQVLTRQHQRPRPPDGRSCVHRRTCASTSASAPAWLPEMASARPEASTSRRMRTDDLPSSVRRTCHDWEAGPTRMRR